MSQTGDSPPRIAAPALVLAVLHSLLLMGCGFFDWPSVDEWVPPGAPAPARALATRQPCADRDPLRRALFGDLHVHTAYSFDARSRDMLGTPDDAYRFARGEAIGLGPFDAERKGARTARLERPLDFAAVTDHAEWIGEVTQCTTPGSSAYASESCQGFRGEVPVRSLAAWLVGPRRMLAIIGVFSRSGEVCGPDAKECRSALATAWQDTQQATERWYDRSSACSFTTFHGWEHSYSPARSKVHRNVIFRNELVPELPISALEQPDALGLWERLDAECNASGTGCEVVTIPHNPNVSNGRLFAIQYRDQQIEEQRRQAALQARIEPLVEMMQIKGESECAGGMYGVVGEDELCGFEKIRAGGPTPPEDCVEGTGEGAVFGGGCQSRLDFARYVVVEGLREERRIGVNPYRLGFVGSTDTHNATPGDVEEHSYQGCCSNTDATPATRLSQEIGFAGRAPTARNPGGLMGVWSEENSRDAIFEAIQRRETFATSGPRISPRFFGGWSLAEDLCERPDLVERGYRDAVAMGGVLSASAEAGRSPVFVASALRDPGTTAHGGGLLQRLQIVKVWADDEERFHQEVHELAGSGESTASVDLDTCRPTGPGHDSLCGVWRDPDFDSARSAAYYVRVIENPSCRWTAWECSRLPPDQRPQACEDASIPRVIQERAWTSPIWYAAGR
jgi:hypothetical protein